MQHAWSCSASGSPPLDVLNSIRNQVPGAKASVHPSNHRYIDHQLAGVELLVDGCPPGAIHILLAGSATPDGKVQLHTDLSFEPTPIAPSSELLTDTSSQIPLAGDPSLLVRGDPGAS